MGGAPFRINGARLLDSIARLAEIGATPEGGAERLAFTSRGRRRPRPGPVVDGGRRTAGPGGRDRKRHRSPGRRGSGRRSGDARFAHRHGRQRRPLRRQPGRARRARGGPHAQRPGHLDPPPPRSRDLLERGGFALPPGHDGEPGLYRRARPRERLGAPESRGDPDPEGGNSRRSAISGKRPSPARFRRHTSNSTSSRDRCSRRRAPTSAR